MFVKGEYLSPAIGLIRISKPDTLNALCGELLSELKGAVDAFAADEALRVLIFIGEGKAFVAGADISEMKDMSPEEALQYARAGAGLFREIEFLDKVTIAAVNGYALGGGCELALACDIRIAADNARFGQPEVGLGIIPGFSGIRRMMETVGEARAKEYVFSGRVFDAAEAEKAGLVNRVVSPGELIPSCVALAEAISAKSFHAVLAAKKLMNAWKGDVREAINAQSESFAACFSHPDQKREMAAFLNKEKR